MFLPFCVRWCVVCHCNGGVLVEASTLYYVRTKNILMKNDARRVLLEVLHKQNHSKEKEQHRANHNKIALVTIYRAKHIKRF